MVVYRENKEISRSLSIRATALLVLALIIEVVIAIWIVTRLIVGVWKGNGLDVYEVITLYAILPSVRMW